MQHVSKAYKKSMKELLRERSYMMVSFGLVNQEAQSNAQVSGGDFSYYSNSNIFGQKEVSAVYATYEQDFTKVDGSMFFPPREAPNSQYYDTGLVGRDLVTEDGYTIEINFNIIPTDVKGLTINFGEVYPVDFDVVTERGVVHEYRGNDKSEWQTEDVYENTSKLRFVFYKMSHTPARVRIYSFLLGFGLIYYNDDIMDSSLESYISPISADVSQIDFFVKLQNYDQYFNVDNPNSAINFLETGQKMYVYYGYATPGVDNVEWIKGGTLLCSAWESDDFTATIRCQDVFRTMDSEYYKGIYRPDGITLYDHAVLIFQDAGFAPGEYYIDPYLKKIRTKNPMPRVTHKEALQIIANAGRCVLSQNRDGQPQIKSSFMPEIYISCNGETEYSHIENIKSEADKDEYASLAHEYTRVDAHNRFLPTLQSQADAYTGYVSMAQSDANCEFDVNPIITITQEAETMYYGFRIVFGSVLPSEFIVRTYKSNNLVSEFTYGEDVIVRKMVVLEEFPDFDTMQIEFTKTAEPYNRIVVNHFSFGDITDFTMERTDMTTSPKSIKQELVRAVSVNCYSYNNSAQSDVIVSEEVDAVNGETETFFLGEASYGFTVKIGESSTGAKVIDSGAYYVTVQYQVTGTYQIEISAYRYTIATRTAVNTLNVRGKTIPWNNPLISDMEAARDLATWLGDYYTAGIEYEYDSRGNPEIDANDIVYQENQFRENMKVCIYRHTVNFNTSLSGKVVARRSISTLPNSQGGS